MGRPSYSLEVYPPRPEGETLFYQSLDIFCKLQPAFISVTCSASGLRSPRGRTKEIALRIQARKQTPAIHMTCMNQSRATLAAEAQEYKRLGMTRIVALRGDHPVGLPKTKETQKTTAPKAQKLPVSDSDPAQPSSSRSSRSGFSGSSGSSDNSGSSDSSAAEGKEIDDMKHAVELVALLHEMGGFDISVAAHPETHPEAKSAQQDLYYLKEKLDAGAERSITQFFLDPEVYLRFRDRAMAIGIHKPIVPGLLPILNLERILPFAEKCGTNVPKFLLKMFDKSKQQDLDRKLLAMNILTHQLTKLLDEGVESFHFYTLNETLLNSHICTWIDQAL